MATADQYAEWIVNNADKRGTPEFDTVAQAYQLAKQEESVAPVIAPPMPKEGVGQSLVRGFKSYVPQLKESIGGLGVLAGKGIQEAFGPGEVSAGMIKSGVERMKAADEQQQAMMRPGEGSFTQALDKGIGTVLSEWLPYQVGSGAANLLESLALIGAGTLIGSAVAPGVGTAAGAVTGAVDKELAKKGVLEAAKKIAIAEGEEAAKKYMEKAVLDTAKDIAVRRGQTALLAGQAAGYGFGQVTSRAVQEAQERGEAPDTIELSRVLPAGLVSTAAEFMSDKIGLGAFKGLKKETQQELTDQAAGLLNKSLQKVGDVSKGILVTGAKEAPTEIVQQAAERYGAKLSLTDAKALTEYMDAAAAAFAMSVVPGGIGGLRTQEEARAETPSPRGLPAPREEGIVKAEAPKPETGEVGITTPEEETAVSREVEKQARPTIPELRTRIDREAELQRQREQAGFEIERTMAEKQIATARERGMPEREERPDYVDLRPLRTPLEQRQAMTIAREEARQQGIDPERLELVPHPKIPEAMTIVRRAVTPEVKAPEPTIKPEEAQRRIEKAATEGQKVQRRREDEARQVVLNRALKNIEERGGIASPEEARVVDEANIGKPYDRVDDSLGRTLSTDERLTEATGILVGRVAEMTPEAPIPPKKTLEEVPTPERRVPSGLTEEEITRRLQQARGEVAPEAPVTTPTPPVAEAPPEVTPPEVTPPREKQPPVTSYEQFLERLPEAPEVPAVRQANDAGDFRQLVGALKQSQNPVIQRIGELGEKIANKTKLRKPGVIKEMRRAAGVYRHADDSIQMNPKYAGSEQVNAHETLHALVAKAQRAPTEKQKATVKKIELLYQHVKRELEKQGIKPRDMYGLKNQYEFVAEAMSDPQFQYTLMQIPYKGNQSAWSAFVQMVADLLGIENTNALTEVMALTEKLAQMQPRRRKTTEAVIEATETKKIPPKKSWPKDVVRIVDSETWDDNLGGAAVAMHRWTDGKPRYLSYHVTDDPRKVRKLLENNTDLKSTYGQGRHAELGPGLYMSARPEAWMSRSVTATPETVPVELEGKFVEFDREPTRKDIQTVMSWGVQGAYLKGSMGGVMQLVVWDNDAVRKFGDWENSSPPPVRDEGEFALFSVKPEPTYRGQVGKETPPTPTTAGQQALDTINQLGMGVKEPEPGMLKQAGDALKRLGENPTLTIKDALKAFGEWMSKRESEIFSADAKFEADVRKALQSDTKNWKAFLGALLSISQSGAVHADAVATQAVLTGKAQFDPEIQKWVAVEAEHNMKVLAAQLDKIAEKYGLTKEEATRVAHTYFVAKNYNGILARNAKLEAEAEALKAEGKKDEARDKRDAIVFVSDEQAAMVQPGLDLVKTIPELSQMVETWQGIRKNFVKTLVDSYLWSPEYATAMLDNIDYVPFYRERLTEEDEGPQMMIRGLQVKAKEMKLKGSEAAVNDVFDNMAMWMQYAMNRAIRNHKALQMIDVATDLKVGDKMMAEKVPEPKRGMNIVRVWRDGKQEFYNMADPYYLPAFQSLGAVAIPAIKFFTDISNLLRRTVVMYPLFSAGQLTQDSVAAIFASGLKPKYAFKIPFLAVKEFIKTYRGTSEVHKELTKFGAVGVRDFNAAVARQDAEILAGIKMPRGGKEKLNFMLERIAMSADNAVRQAVYQATMDAGLSKAEAVEKAFEIINFRRRGSSKLLNLFGQTVPFFYAYLSAQRVAYRTITGVGISPQERLAALETLAMTSAAVMTLSFLYAMANGEDEAYEKTPGTVRDRSLVIPGTNGVRVPLRPDFFLFPKVIAEHTYHLLVDNGLSDPGKFKKGMADIFSNAVLSPNVVPQVIKPTLEASINYSFFEGKPIVGFFEKNKEAGRQFSESTSEFAKLLGNYGASPQVVDHLIRGYLGSVGGLFLWGTNFMIDGMPGVPRQDITWQDAVKTLPGVGAFKQKSTENALKVDFYELRDEVEKAKNTFDDIKRRSPEGLQDFINDEKRFAKLALEKRVTRIADELSKIRRAIQQIAAAPEDRFSAQEKGERIEELREIERNLLKAVDVRGMREQAMM